MKHSLADISLSRDKLGYEVVADLHYGLEQTIAWYREQAAQA